ncbi:MAG TPA: Tex-like N-terminal domain-containing protein [Pirellulales bacterium]|nr:Tex-like N-terminal domain-containing protein [Pirellulales bacterium]
MGTISTVAIDLRSIAGPLQIPLPRVERVIELLDAGNTVPFITRYRKDETGGLDEEQIRQIQQRLGKLRLLGERKQTILRSIESQGKLTEALAAEIEAAESTKRLEDLYLPFKPKKQTLATLARERGLEPLAEEVLSASPMAANLDARAAEFVATDRGVTSPADALLGVGHILAEIFSERADLRQRLRKILQRTGKLTSARAEPDDKKSQGFRDYFAYSEQLGQVPPHRILAINRGERAKVLRVKVEADMPAMEQTADELLVPADHPHADLLRGCARDALSRLVFPSLEREARRELTDRAEAHAVQVFARNLRNLLLQAPVRSRRVLAADPGFKSGCKLAALDEFGNLLAHAVIHLVGKAERREEAKAKLVELITAHDLSLVAIGNGTACRETEELIGELLTSELAEKSVAYVIVNEAGASVYSASPLGREEFPEYDATLRGAISIGRRLQDPLSELVKIDPASIGVGMYQHDVKAKHLRASLDDVVESCVNFVGVDLNTASPALLRYVSGLNQLTARRVYDYRSEHGPFRSREQLKEVPGFGEAAFVQAAGFLKIVGRDNPLDATWIHPESYPLAERVLESISARVADLADSESAARVAEQAAQTPVEALAAKCEGGTLLLGDILAQLARPGRDPREDLPPPIFKKGVIKLDDLSPGMELSGTVLNVVDFGAFVDIGLHDTGLVHISQLANKYVRDPHEVVSVGDTVKVWVHEIDKTRRRVSLTMIAPGTPRGNERRSRPKRGEKPAAAPSTPANGESAAAQTAPPAGGAPARRPREQSSRPAGGGRPPRHGDATRQAGSHDRPPRPKFKSGPPKKPKPLVPITAAMKEGREPLRTFGDLKQFLEQKAPSPAGEAAESSTGTKKPQPNHAREQAPAQIAGDAPTPHPETTAHAVEPEPSSGGGQNAADGPAVDGPAVDGPSVD